ncbi:hypothetical protein CDD81_2738 [Ophiocordyceps australis]|uniref:DUF292-domain-containing protein n=1 Tax=Ophiocordyceps australis TaxID=1399860 RepID=A0A2C5YC85_9HYPO|nr:hypothetical protein CDD81_2738 [Ophiocordyceps australis]
MPAQAPLVTKLKVQLKLAIARLRMVQQRDEQLGKTQRRAMAQLLEAGKIESATIRVEGIIRSDIISELHEILELYCELLLARSGLLEGPVCDAGLEEAVKSIMYAAPRTEIKELVVVRQLLGEKYGKEFAREAMDNVGDKVSDKVMRKLSVEPPRPELVQGYLEEIAKAYGVDWPRGSLARSAPAEPEPLDSRQDDQDQEGYGGGNGSSGTPAQKASQQTATSEPQDTSRTEQVNLKQPTPPNENAGTPRSPLTVTPPRMTTDNVHPKVTLGSVELKPGSGRAAATPRNKEPEGSVPDIGDLERRFAALKKR